jgi:hypothetical protein
MDELSDTKIRNATPTDKEYAIADGQGLSVVVRPNGTKLRLYRYRFAGKRKNMSSGTFPGVGLKAARAKRYDAEKLLDQGQDPVAVREAKRKEDEKLKHTFRAVGEEWATTTSKTRTRPSRRSSGNAGISLSSILRSATDRFAMSLRRNC